ncbi:hypothetical protein G6F42_006257 [Rhizopus arrhizus]|nr:hypothetical protein G6F42_006257 [Rhizopus arrhizus]
MYTSSSIQRLPLECLRDICDLLSWNDFYSLAKTSRSSWSSLNSFRFMQGNKPFVITDDKMARLSRSYSGSQRTFEKCIFAKTCTHLLFPADTAIKNGIMYLLLRVFRNLTLLDICNAKTTERERRALLQMVNKRFSGCIIKVCQNAYLEWSSLASEIQCLSLMIVADNMEKMHNASERKEEGAFDDLPMDNFCTPAHVEKQVASFRDFLKRQLLSKGLLSLNSECTNSTSSSFQPPQFLFQFGFQNTVAGEVGAMFVESIIVVGTLWILVSQVDVFLSNSALDDCAYDTNIADLSQITFDIVKKQESSVRWKEVIIQYGPFQLLVMGGIWGDFNDKRSGKAFLGCSVPFSMPKNQHDGFVCYLPSSRPASYHQTYRYLRDYSKLDSRLQFAFISQRFKAAGLSAVHPPLFQGTH